MLAIDGVQREYELPYLKGSSKTMTANYGLMLRGTTLKRSL
jgi:hypothetical protein